MAHYGLLRDYRFEDLNTEDDIRGSHVYGYNDEDLGKIDDVIFDYATGSIRYVVVDTGGWFTHKKFLIPPHRLHSSAEHDGDFAVNLNKSQIETLPRYNEADVETDEKFKQYEKEYDAAWASGPVMHREGSDHSITPTPEEFPAEPNSIGSQLSGSEQSRLNSRITPVAGDEMTIQNSAMGIGSRWLTFEDRLRQRRRDIAGGGSMGPASESATQERKAV